jgi:hypothetical protein
VRAARLDGGFGDAACGNAVFGALTEAAFSPRRRSAGFDGALFRAVVRELDIV